MTVRYCNCEVGLEVERNAMGGVSPRVRRVNFFLIVTVCRESPIGDLAVTLWM